MYQNFGRQFSVFDGVDFLTESSCNYLVLALESYYLQLFRILLPASTVQRLTLTLFFFSSLYPELQDILPGIINQLGTYRHISHYLHFMSICVTYLQNHKTESI